MVALSYMLDTTRGNGKTVSCFKNDSDISSTSGYDFGWNLTKAMALPHVQRRSLNGLASSVQLRMKIILGPVPKVERSFTGTGQEKMSIIHGQFPHKDRKGKWPKINWTVPIMWYQYLPGTFNASLPWYLTMKFYISYWLWLAFRLCSNMTVFYTSLEVTKLAFLENKSRHALLYIC